MNLRWALHVPAVAGLPAQSFWSGDSDLTLGGVTYVAGQWSDPRDGEQVSAIPSGEATANADVVLTFAATGLFRTWLLSGDVAGRIATVRQLEDDAGTWTERLTTGEGMLSEPIDLGNGLIELSMTSRPLFRSDVPPVLTDATYRARYPNSTAMRWQTLIAKGVNPGWPSTG